ncbi:hypothetical protein [Sphingorhabdus sp.]|jgi:hypothetical protein|uniref:hypothetical protein n=1 Tax=Sphingorhabdus sp. TaxID=1902408 RepID=UPI0037CA4575
MIKKLVSAFMLVGSVMASSNAVATDEIEPEQIPEIYCIRDFYTGDLMCIQMPPPPGPVLT